MIDFTFELTFIPNVLTLLYAEAVHVLG